MLKLQEYINLNNKMKDTSVSLKEKLDLLDKLYVNNKIDQREFDGLQGRAYYTYEQMKKEQTK